MTVFSADKIPFKRLFHDGGDALCVSFTLYNWLTLYPTEQLLYIKYVPSSTQVHPGAASSPFI